MGKDKLKVGDIIATPERLGHCWKIVLYAKKSMKLNCDKPGLYAFYGMWYGDNPLDVKSFGKIEYIGSDYIYIGNVKNIPKTEIKDRLSY